MDVSEQIDQQIAELADWRGDLMTRLRKLIKDTDPELAEELNWGTPVFSKHGNICALGAFKDHVKINFFKGVSITDPEGLFNSGLDAKQTRAIDFYEGDSVNEAALQALIRTAVDINTGKS
jgi:hypothetical protein